jgi:O-antigen ligase
VHARFDYWRAAGQTIAAKPILGSGPGTFGEAYKAVKKPESEMARLAHNDYLQQASDSGLLGGAIYIVWICGMGYLGYLNANSGNNRTGFFAWLGVLGWVLQGITEFGLYIPALAWTAFSLAGALCGKGVAGIDVR